MSFKSWLMLYLLFGVLGVALEWCYGALWDVVSSSPWVYPDSPLYYSSLAGLPLWGFGGIICVVVYNVIKEKDTRLLRGMIIPLFLSVLWILFYGCVFAGS